MSTYEHYQQIARDLESGPGRPTEQGKKLLTSVLACLSADELRQVLREDKSCLVMVREAELREALARAIK
jgi:hypothetical protein